MLESSGMPCDRNMSCLVRSPVSISLSSWSPVPMVDLWLSPRTWISAAPGSPTGSAGASKPYSLARLVRTLSAPLGSYAVSPRCTYLPSCPAIDLASPTALARSSPPRVRSCHHFPWFLWWCGGGSVPSLPPYVLPRHFVSLGGHSRGFLPRGDSSTPGLSMT